MALSDRSHAMWRVRAASVRASLFTSVTAIGGALTRLSRP